MSEFSRQYNYITCKAQATIIPLIQAINDILPNKVDNNEFSLREGGILFTDKITGKEITLHYVENSFFINFFK